MIRQPDLLWLTHTLLFHDPTANYRFRSLTPGAPGPGSDRYPIPREKSLFGKENARGLPIGNLTSQFWGNVYLNELDEFVKAAAAVPLLPALRGRSGAALRATGRAGSVARGDRDVPAGAAAA